MIDEIIKKQLIAEFEAIPPKEELEKMYQFSERHEKQMEIIFTELRNRERSERCWCTVRKIAVIVMAILTLTFVSVKFVPEVYAQIKAWFDNTFDDRMSFNRDVGKETEKTGEIVGVEFGYVPDGYWLESEGYSDVGNYRLIYVNEDERDYRFCCSVGSIDSKISVNTEKTYYEEINFEDKLYYIFDENDGKKYIVWQYGEYICEIKGEGSEEKMLEMAINVKVFLK